jgi:hypothetical protein
MMFISLADMITMLVCFLLPLQRTGIFCYKIINKETLSSNKYIPSFA